MQEIMKSIIENMIFPIWVKDLNLNMIFVNNKYAEMHSKTVEEIIGLRNKDLYDEATAKIFDEYCINVMKTKEPSIEEIYGEYGYRQCYLMPIKNEAGEIIAIAGIISTINDIGRFKEKEHEAEIQKILTKQIIDMLPGVIFYKDNNSRYIYANKSCTEFYKERGIDNIFGKTDAEINPDKNLVKKFLEDDKKIVETKDPIFNEVVFNNNDGSKTYREVIKIPLIDTHGNVTGIVGRSLDITERKLVQERLEYLSYTDILTGAKNRACFEEREKQFSKEEYLPLGIIMGDANGLKLVNDTFGHREGDNLLIEITKVLKEVTSEIGEVFRIGGDEFVIMMPNISLKECEDIIHKILKRCKEYESNIFNISISLGSAIKDDINKDIYDVIKEAEDKVYRQKLLQNKSIKSSILNSLKIGLDVISKETEEHSNRVAANAVKVGEKLGLEMSQLDELKIAADLHDIGKIGISEDILLKPDKLTTEEFEIMKTHSEKGYRIVKASSELKIVAESVLHHHERYDGNGYPMGLKAEEIPLLSRIISVCDSYDAMINERSYRKAMSKESALEEIKRCSGTQFDPRVVDAFIELYSE